MTSGDLQRDWRVTEIRKPTVSVVIPARNEALSLPHVFAALDPDLHEVILVDGGSVDDTIDVAERLWPGIIVVSQTRQGKGNALACGFEVATGDLIVMLEADGSADPAEIPRFVEALARGADFAKGTRFLPGAGSSDLSRLRRVGNHCLSRVFNLVYRTRFTDLCYGYNAFRRDCLPAMGLVAKEIDGHDGRSMVWGDGFEVEALISVRIAMMGLRVTEVPSFEHARLFGASNLNAFTDGIRVLRTIQRERRRSSRELRQPVGSENPEDAPWRVRPRLAEEAI
jgi:glycosyltransferase involved in cell wall biosynthesis